MLKVKLQNFGHLMWRTDSFEKTLMLGKIEGGRRRGQQRMRWLDGITDSLTWVWVSSRIWWWTGRPGVLQLMGLQRVGHDWVTELNLMVYGEGNGTPLQYSCLENPMVGGALRAAVHGVAKSWTQLSDFAFTFSLSCIGEGNGNPLQCSCLENPREGGAWWAAIYGVAQSRTWLKQLSSSSLYSLVINVFILFRMFNIVFKPSLF